ncbi:MAG: hypothetical protein Q9157_007219, partial [Trypethelium eluteriae]
GGGGFGFDVPDFDEAVAAGGGDLGPSTTVGAAVGAVGGGGREPDDFEDAIRVPFEGSETAVILMAPSAAPAAKSVPVWSTADVTVGVTCGLIVRCSSAVKAPSADRRRYVRTAREREQGRSAFEPLEQSQSIEEQLDFIAQHDLGADSFDPNESCTQSTSSQTGSLGDHTQQYDDRGYPCDPGAQARASQMRQAQNDVLAAVGVVKRRDDRAKEARSVVDKIAAERMKLEDIVGTTLDVNFLALFFCATWWFENLRLRFMTFPYPLDLSSFDIFEIERRCLGNYAFFMAGLPAYVFYHLAIEGVEQCVDLSTKHVMRLLIATVQSRAQRNRYTNYISNLGTASKVAARFFLSPVLMYSRLQRVCLIPALPIIPHWTSLIPFNKASPFQLFPKPTASPGPGLRNWTWSMLAFPTTIYLILFVIDYMDEFVIPELPEADLIAPTTYQKKAEDPANSMPRSPFRGKYEKFVDPRLFERICDLRDHFLQAVGWMERPRRLVLRKAHAPSTSIPPTLPSPPALPPNLNVGIGDVESTSSSSPATSAYTEALENQSPFGGSSQDPALEALDLPTARDMPAFDGQRDGSRISSRISSRSSSRSSSGRRTGTVQRLSELSLGPAMFLATLVDSSIMECVFAPVEAMMARSLSGAFLSATSGLNAEQQVNARATREELYPVMANPVVGGMLGLFGAGRRFGLQGSVGRVDRLWAIGVYVGRIGLTWAAQTSLSLSIWGVQWATVRTIGKMFFGWGRL